MTHLTLFTVFSIKDNHESYKRAIDRLKNQKPQKYQAITSTPCFEFWFLPITNTPQHHVNRKKF